MSYLGKPADKNATKPIYIVTVLDENSDPVYVKTRQDLLNIYETHVEIRGIEITKTNISKLKKAKELDKTLGERDKQIHWLIPLSRWIKTENISFGGLA